MGQLFATLLPWTMILFVESVRICHVVDLEREVEEATMVFKDGALVCRFLSESMGGL